MSEQVITPKFHVGQTVYPSFNSDAGPMTIERVEVVSVVCYIIDGVSWSEDELRFGTFKEAEAELRSDPEANARIEAAKAEIKRRTYCPHVKFLVPEPFIGNPYHYGRDLGYEFCPDCGDNLAELPTKCEHVDFFGNSYNVRLYQHKFCPDCGEKL
jgi:ribosomal protein S27AE